MASRRFLMENSMTRKFALLAGVSALAAIAAVPAVKADAVADFYKGKNITLIIPYSAGGMYGINGRIMSRYIGRHIPGKPNVVVQHMTGQGGTKGANYFYNAAAQDGSVIAELSKDLAVAQVLRPGRVKYDARKIHFLGRMQPYAAVLMVWHTQGINTVEDARRKQVIVASSGKSSHDYMEASLLRHFAGMKLKSVTGYRGAAGMYKAMESGETHARIGAWNSLKAAKPDWLRDKKVSIVLQTGLKKQPDLPNIPLMLDLMPDGEAKKMAEVMSLGGPVGWGLQAPPGTPADRVAALRTAFDRMVVDPDFLAEIKKRNVGGETATGAEVEGYIKRTFSISPELVKKMQKIAGFN
jgi:tripartite-type tricarboxylate transporter receptor subunit TctC